MTILGKTVCSVAGLDATGAVVFRKLYEEILAVRA
jgi:hypothetical protein